MASFLLGREEAAERKVRRASVLWLCDLNLPDRIKESLPYRQVEKINGLVCMSFYCDPVENDVFEYWGHWWRVRARKHMPTRYRSHQKKQVSVLVLDYLGTEDPLSLTGSDLDSGETR